MQLRISPSMRSITISSSNGVVDSMKVRVAPQPPPPPPPLALQGAGAGRRGGGGGGGGAGWYWRAVAFPVVVALGLLLPFAFILTAVPALEAGGSKCSSIDETAKWEKITYVGIVTCTLLAMYTLSKGHPHHEEPPDDYSAAAMAQYEDDWE